MCMCAVVGDGQKRRETVCDNNVASTTVYVHRINNFNSIVKSLQYFFNGVPNEIEFFLL